MYQTVNHRQHLLVSPSIDNAISTTGALVVGLRYAVRFYNQSFRFIFGAKYSLYKIHALFFCRKEKHKYNRLRQILKKPIFQEC